MLSDIFDMLLDSIRKLNGFEHFLLTPTELKLKILATSDSIIAFNISRIRSDIFVITLDDIHVVSLSLLKYIQLESYNKCFLKVVDIVRIIDHRNVSVELRKVLRWL